MEHNCGFTDGGRWFRYRAAAIIVEEGCALFAGNETAEDAVRREVLEETGVEYEVDRLAVIHENFFSENHGSLNGLDCHELAFYFLMKPRGTRELNSNSYTVGVRETMHWLPTSELDKFKAYPTFLKEYLTTSHSGIEHIVTDERKAGKA